MISSAPQLSWRPLHPYPPHGTPPHKHSATQQTRHTSCKLGASYCQNNVLETCTQPPNLKSALSQSIRPCTGPPDSTEAIERGLKPTIGENPTGPIYPITSATPCPQCSTACLLVCGRFLKQSSCSSLPVLNYELTTNRSIRTHPHLSTQEHNHVHTHTSTLFHKHIRIRPHSAHSLAGGRCGRFV